MKARIGIFYNHQNYISTNTFEPRTLDNKSLEEITNSITNWEVYKQNNNRGFQNGVHKTTLYLAGYSKQLAKFEFIVVE